MPPPRRSVQELSALAARAAHARDGVAAVLLEVELVVVGDLLAHLDGALGVEHDAELAAGLDDARVAVGVAAVVGKAGDAALLGGVHLGLGLGLG